MAQHSTEDVTQMLATWSDGDEAALERLVPVIHAELRRLARRYLARERPGHTLQTSALVNEAYLRLIKWKGARFQDRAHFFGVSAQLMRRILVDFARAATRGRAGGQARRTRRSPGRLAWALDEALVELAKLDGRKARVVELRFFGGLSVEEMAEVLKVSPVTVMREWAKAKAWLYRELSAGGGGHAG